MNSPVNNSSLPPGLSRRTVLGVSVAGAAGLLTAACGGSSGGSTKTASGSNSTPSAAGSSASSGGGGSSGGLVSTAKVPVGEGVILTDQKIVVTQPTKGDFKAFSAICTHMACTVASIQDGTITCPCHGSQYSIKDGSVLGGPAPKPLPAIAIKVSGTEIVKA
jgi:Rieske Fe-S protein